MIHPTVSKRARARGRADGCSIVSPDPSPGLAAVQPLQNGQAVEKIASFSLPNGSPDSTQSELTDHTNLSATITRVLHSSIDHIDRSAQLIVTIQDSIATTVQAIRSTQRLLCESDKLIARMKTLDCEWMKPRL